MPDTVSFVCFGSTAASTPVGSGYSIGCEYPSVNTTMPLPFISARYPMPTISSSRVHPLVTPSTALFTKARVSPCSAACESFSRSATRWPSCCSTLIPRGTTVSSLPLGPCTKTVLPSIVIVTPLGSAIGFFPIRDIKEALSYQLSAISSQLSALSYQLSALSYQFHPSLLTDG